MPPKPRPEHDRFWEKVDKNGPTPAHRPDLGPCWIWTGSQNGHGYGNFRKYKVVGPVMAHVFSYEEIHGEVPEGLDLDHLCRTRRCVNDAHLEPVTNKENILRGVGFAAVNARKTHCHNGHELKGDNLYAPRPKNLRACKICTRARSLKRGARLRELFGAEGRNA